MKCNEAALRALRAQAQFEIAKAAADVARATARSTEAQRHLRLAIERRERAAGALRSVMAQERINPALIGAVRLMYQLEQRASSERRSQLEAAERCEQDARAVLADARNRERSLGRAIATLLRNRRDERRASEFVDADELWLQHATRVRR